MTLAVRPALGALVRITAGRDPHRLSPVARPQPTGG